MLRELKRVPGLRRRTPDTPKPKAFHLKNESPRGEDASLLLCTSAIYRPRIVSTKKTGRPTGSTPGGSPSYHPPRSHLP